jgi:hypothetical protein
VAYGTFTAGPFTAGTDAARNLATFAAHVGAQLGREPLVIGDLARPVHRVAWCTGAAQGYFETAVALGVDVYVTGEISEQHVHLARESGVAFVAAGHHATERFGVQAVGAHLAQTFGLRHRFIDAESSPCGHGRAISPSNQGITSKNHALGASAIIRALPPPKNDNRPLLCPIPPELHLPVRSAVLP